MALTLDKVLGAYKQRIPYVKTNSVTTVAGVPFILIDRAGYPVAGSLNPNDVLAGIVPTGATPTTGFPLIEAPQGSNRLFLNRVEISSSVAMSVWLFDVLFEAGQTTIPTSGATTVTLSGMASFASRVPYKSDGVTRDYSQVELYIMMSVAGSNHAHSTVINYLDEGGAAGSTVSQTTQSMIVNRLIRCPLASGDAGVSAITGYVVTGATSSTGAVSALAMRRLGKFRTMGGLSGIYGPDYTGLPEIYSTSALMAVVLTDSTSSGVPDITIEIAHMVP